jgi:tRNA (uracil-5-)-methyltransferase
METSSENKVPLTCASVPTENEFDRKLEPSSTTLVDASADAPTNTYHSALDSTPRKVVVHNVLKFLNNKQIDKIVKSWLDDAAKPGGFHLVIDRYKKPPSNGWINVTVADNCMVEPFINLINGTKRVNKRGQIMVARRAGEESGNSRNDRKKRTRDDKDGGAFDSKRARPDVPACPTPSQIRDKITAMWSKPYPAQLEAKKTDMIRNCAFKIIKEMRSKFRTIEKEAKRNPNHCVKMDIFSWVDEKPPIPVENVVPSPLVMRYRNKCELTFGYRCPEESENGVLDNDTHVEAIEKKSKSDNDQDISETGDEDAIKNADESTSSPTIPGKVESPARIPALGFLPYGWRHSVARPHGLQNIPDEVCAITDLIDHFLLSSPFAPYDTSVHRGLWRSITIRSSERTRQVMVIVVHASPEGGAGEIKTTSDECSNIKKEKRTLFEKERDRLVSVLTKDELITPTRYLPSVQMLREKDLVKDEEVPMGDKGPGEKVEKIAEKETSAFRVTSIFFQEYNGLSSPSVSHPVQHAYGSKFIEEKLGANTYQISPGAFFQVTTAGAEILYNVVADRIKEVSDDPADTLMFDVCCGTGTIGLHCLAEGVVGKVVGVDISKPAIEDALANAKRNGFGDGDNKGKTRFVASRAELIMGRELERVNDARGDDRPPRSIVAVVDPARDGLHPDVIKALRSTKEIQRLVYVSCNPTGSLVKDTMILCCPATKKYRGLPFKPTRAQPVDMFPLTPHCEMVMTFDRMTAKEVEGNSENGVVNTTSVEPKNEHCEIEKEEKNLKEVEGNSENGVVNTSSVEPRNEQCEIEKEET